ncbi:MULTISPECIES: metallophosphoesterase [unclassified Thiocapsa]|uniref:metallophosphoesterase n=1 Tax=unclassified Thiocapsa TaxID=2641286 RepID=UPI0035B424B9
MTYEDRSKASALTVVLCLATIGFPAVAVDSAPDPSPGFRVLPFLEKPASDQMTISWISETPSAGALVMIGPGVKALYRSSPRYLDLLEYTELELTQEIAGLEQGSWLKSNSNYKHSVTIDGLHAGRTYRYFVQQDGKVFRGKFNAAPSADEWKHLRIIAFSDTETEPRGRIEKREWELHPITGYTEESIKRPGEGSLYAAQHGSTTRYGEFTLRYPMTQDAALKANMSIIEGARPDLMLVAGDLVQGAGYQPAWDEWFRYFAGEHGSLAGRIPVLPALGNWETYAALNGGYGSATDRSPVVTSRNKYHAYFDTFGDSDNPHFKDSYYRVDFGPVTVITLDSTNGIPDEDTKTGELSNPIFSGDDSSLTQANLSTDTQGEFKADEYAAAFDLLFGGVPDLPSFNPGSAQWNWAEEQLASARAEGRIILVQFHHAAYSNGVHGTPPNHEYPDNQSGVAMRAYTPMFEAYGVAAVLSGHDEMFERSYIDEDGDGVGFQSYDVGVAADGLRGEQLALQPDGSYAPIRFNTRSEWSASAEAPETWAPDTNGNPRLIDGGLHYGHLQMDLTRTRCGAEMTLTPVYVFPMMDEDYNVTDTERRVYDDVVTIHFDTRGQVMRQATDCRSDQ